MEERAAGPFPPLSGRLCSIVWLLGKESMVSRSAPLPFFPLLARAMALGQAGSSPPFSFQ